MDSPKAAQEAREVRTATKSHMVEGLQLPGLQVCPGCSEEQGIQPQSFILRPQLGRYRPRALPAPKLPPRTPAPTACLPNQGTVENSSSF